MLVETSKPLRDVASPTRRVHLEMGDAEPSCGLLQIGRERRFGDEQRAHCAARRLLLLSLHDGAILDALIDATSQIGPVRVPGLDLDGEDFARGLVDDVDAVGGAQLDFGVRLDIAKPLGDPPGMVLHPLAQRPVVGSFPGAAALLAASARGRRVEGVGDVAS